ncbi:VapC toxin family PIN domain ribonuclease [Lysobacteraceae bacterium NML03-0222]|nr:VapC toxin family PIN domain ribonuclease [Xanthomonadaceae bacterium NML03-0222]
MLYVLDTNILIAMLKGDARVAARLAMLPLSQLRLSCIVLGELEFGAEKSAYSVQNRARITELKQCMPLLGIDAETASHYTHIRQALEARGTPIGANDLWIAAQVRSIGATLVSHNLREFQRVDGLLLEDWLAPR